MELTRMNDIQTRLKAISEKMLTVAETTVDHLISPPAAPPPVVVVRRQVANTFKLWKACDNKTCNRAQCCRGEPLHCLRYGLPLMPEAMVALLQMRSPNRRRRAPLARPRRT
jgi:hypothetical protein